MMAGYVPVPKDAINAAEPCEYLAVLDLYRRAHALRWKPVRLTERSMCTSWKLGNTRVWSLLEAFEDLGLIKLERGGRRKPTVVTVFDPTARHTDQRTEQHKDMQSDAQNNRGSKPDTDLSAAPIAASPAAPIAAPIAATLDEPDTEPEPKPETEHEGKVSGKPAHPHFDLLAKQWADAANDARTRMVNRRDRDKKPRAIKPPKWSSNGENTKAIKRILAEAGENGDDPAEIGVLFRWHWNGPDDAKNREEGRGLMTLARHYSRYLVSAFDWEAGLKTPTGKRGDIRPSKIEEPPKFRVVELDKNGDNRRQAAERRYQEEKARKAAERVASLARMHEGRT